MQAFEDTTLPFKDWDHAAHIRMAWNYIKENGKDRATPLIVSVSLLQWKNTGQNVDKIQHRTKMLQWLHLSSGTCTNAHLYKNRSTWWVLSRGVR